MKKLLANKELKSFLVLFFLNCFILLMDRFGIFQPLRAFSEGFLLPPKKTIYQNWQEVKSKIKEIKRSRNCDQGKEQEAKIERLKEEIAQLVARNSQLTLENKAAKRLLGTPLPSEWQFIPAQTAGLVQGILTIDKGKIDGIKVDQVVLTEDIFVGKVEQVGEHQAWVKLPTAAGSKLLAKVIPSREIRNEAKARGLLVGYGEKMRLEKVLPGEQLAEGDLVATAEFPPNLVIGKIRKVVKKDVEIYQEAEVEPLVDYQKLETIFLLK